MNLTPAIPIIDFFSCLVCFTLEFMLLIDIVQLTFFLCVKLAAYGARALRGVPNAWQSIRIRLF